MHNKGIRQDVAMEHNLPIGVSEHNDFQACIKAEIAEMDKFKWFLGEQLGHDPLQDRSLNEIYREWINKFGAAFREWWEKGQKKA